MKRLRTFAAALAVMTAIGAGQAFAEPRTTRAAIMAEQRAANERGALAQIARDGDASPRSVSTIAGAHTARLYAQGVNGGRNGTGNTATVNQYGNNNAVRLRQIGSGINADVTQYRNNNMVQMIQVGNNLDYEVIQTGGQRVFVVQTANGVIVRPVFGN